MVEALDIEVHGIVQGVGFRPFVFGRACAHGLVGWVLNATSGVFIHVEGPPEKIDALVIDLSEHAPAAARVDEIVMHETAVEGFESFSIRHSDKSDTSATTLVSPDLAICDDCVRELFDPNDRRYHYPFINCTNCGPRFTIIEGLPYDRPKTSMKRFAMCDTCADEYANPADRRFHAQPDACFACGPHIFWLDAQKECGELAISDAIWGMTREESDAIFEQAAALLRAGGILAVKGLGGFHLACDAHNEGALAELRRRKRREGKAFAVMMPSLAQAAQVCHFSDAEQTQLTSPQHPIVLLKKRSDARFAPGLADGLPELGVMLPYTPVQHLLAAAFAGPLVMTSGNIHDEPIQTDDTQALQALRGIADAFLGNDRPILCRFDDSVVRVIDVGDTGAIQVVRRARGFAPLPIKASRARAKAEVQVSSRGKESDLGDDTDAAAQQLPSREKAPQIAANEHDTLAARSDTPTAPCILAVGPEQKSTLTLLRGEDAFVSQHIGDMENAAVFDAWLEAKSHFEALFEAPIQALACDLHPEYLATKWAHKESLARSLPLVQTQHHHAHIAAVLGEHDLDEAVIGIAFDGTGYGADGAIWGGEVLIANRADYERFANLSYLPMPGGAAAIKHPLRMAFGTLWQHDLLDHPAAAYVSHSLGSDQTRLCEQMMERGLNTPVTSSAGRLLDAISALLGICTQPTYEGEAAILLEAAIDPAYERMRDAGKLQGQAPFAFGLIKNTACQGSTAHDTSVLLLDSQPLVRSVLDDIEAGVAPGIIAGKVHDALVDAIVLVCQATHAAYGLNTAVLAGGVFMNRYLVEHTAAALNHAGFTVALSNDLPPNDGAISYGQAVIAAKRLEEGEQSCA